MKWYWHIHHDVLMEPLTEPIENRIAFIKANKPADEIELRLRLMKPVRGKLPLAVVKAYAAWAKAYAAWAKAYAARVKAYAARVKAVAAWAKADAAWAKAYAARVKAVADNLPTIEALHAKECPGCPWNDKTIFPDKKNSD